MVRQPTTLLSAIFVFLCILVPFVYAKFEIAVLGVSQGTCINILNPIRKYSQLCLSRNLLGLKK